MNLMTPKEKLADIIAKYTPEERQAYDRELMINGNAYVCTACGKLMRHNVPRMGPAGGWVHAITGAAMCGPYVPPTINTA